MRGDPNITREKLLSAAAQIFAEKGYHSASITDIIKKAGVARGTFYLYFKTKRDIFAHLMSRMLDNIQNQIRRVDLSISTPPEEQMIQNLERVINIARQNKCVTKILLTHIETPDDALRSQKQAAFDRIKELIRASLKTGRKLGLLREIDLEVATHLLFGASTEALKYAIKPECKYSARQLAEQVFRLLGFGLLKSGS